ncbi:MAG: hypothetical protein BWZ10_00651 [candidate division BRC1 bacterium ADurb.BinA364]|nr:MAG: hypothetical protein BWZ10_00651 [candidate division BRC1 bacterium ADurb.BinA364]
MINPKSNPPAASRIFFEEMMFVAYSMITTAKATQKAAMTEMALLGDSKMPH